MRRTRVYIAGPILTSGNPFLNIRRAIQVGTTLLKRGYAPYVPHLTTFWESASPEEFTYEDWLRLDFDYLGVCDAVLRLEGDSQGADRECAYAKLRGIPVYFSLDTLVAGVKPEREAA